jgi:serine acetyltransferase
MNNYYLNIKLSDRINKILVLLSVMLFKHDIRCKVPFTTNFNHFACGVVIAKEVKLGRNCIIGPNVTIGERHGGYPTIEDGVVICCNSVIIGNVTIGKDSVIGAGSVVLDDIPPNSVAVGNPAKVIKKLIKESYLDYRAKRY